MQKFFDVLQALYGLALFNLGIIALMIVCCGVLCWAMDERPLRLGWFSVFLPVRGRWVRYLFAPALLIGSLTLTIGLFSLFSLIPALPGFGIMAAGGVVAWIWLRKDPPTPKVS